MRVYANGRVQAPSADLAPVLTGRMTRYAELPHLAHDGSGALWLVFRHWTYSSPNEIYHFYATRLSGEQWSVPWLFASSAGHTSQHASISLGPGGALAVAYASDGRSQDVKPTEQAHALHYNVYVSMLPRGESPPAVTFANLSLPPPMTRAAPRPRHTMT